MVAGKAFSTTEGKSSLAIEGRAFLAAEAFATTAKETLPTAGEIDDRGRVDYRGAGCVMATDALFDGGTTVSRGPG